MDLKTLNSEEIIELIANSILELKTRKIIRTNNLIGDLGEYLAIKTYNETRNLPNLQPAPIGTKNIDAISREGKRYSIKSTTTNSTGVFSALNEKGNMEINEKFFEYVIICKFNDSFKLEAIYEIDWDTFLKHKKWHKTMGSYHLTITKQLINDSQIIFKSA
ncbi:MAG: hypothetical protein IJH31_04720 [Erysipelotrichaceae bacterium]|nr:hypothetical protein [Erysipelotrichaceae bacterium]